MRKRAMLLLAPMLVVAAGCGDDEGAASTDADTAEALTTEPDTAEAVETVETTDDEIADGADESTAVDGDDSGASGDEASSEWCATARELEDIQSALNADDFAFTDPVVVEEGVTAIVDAVDRGRAVAPDAIADDVETTYDGYSRLADALEAADWNFLDADLTVIDELDAVVGPATDRIAEYNQTMCGIDADVTDDTTGDDSDDSDFDPSLGTPREQMAAGLIALGFTEQEATCVVDSIDLAAYLETNDNAIIEAAFDVCEISDERLVELSES